MKHTLKKTKPCPLCPGTPGCTESPAYGRTIIFRNDRHRTMTKDARCMQCGDMTKDLHLIERKARHHAGFGKTETARYLQRMEHEAADQRLDVLCFRCLLRRIFQAETAQRLLLRSRRRECTLRLMQQDLALPDNTSSFSLAKGVSIRDGEYTAQLLQLRGVTTVSDTGAVNNAASRSAVIRNWVRIQHLRLHFAGLVTGYSPATLTVICANCAQPTRDWVFDHIQSPYHGYSAGVDDPVTQARYLAGIRMQNIQLLCHPCDSVKAAREKAALGILNRWERGQIFYQTLA